jgi:hypothetical protein
LKNHFSFGPALLGEPRRIDYLFGCDSALSCGFFFKEALQLWERGARTGGVSMNAPGQPYEALSGAELEEALRGLLATQFRRRTQEFWQ